MARFNDIIHSFINGEVSPRMYGRTDSDVYRRACKNLKNMYVTPQGQARRRVGTEFRADTVEDCGSGVPASISENSLLVPFEYSDDEKYTVIFPGNDSATTGVDNYLVIYNNSEDSYTSVAPFIFANTGASFVDESTVLRTASKLREMQYAQNGDVMIFTHGEMSPFVLIRLGVNRFMYGSYTDMVARVIGNDPVARPAFNITNTEALQRATPFKEQNTTTITLSFATATGSAVVVTASENIFTANTIGSFFAVQDSGSVGIAYVVGYASATSITADIISTIPTAGVGGNSTTQWYKSAWSDDDGWPRTCAFWNASLCFGGSRTFPDTVWKSQKYDIFEFNKEDVLDLTGTQDSSDYFQASIFAYKAAYINSMAPSNQSLIINTEEKEYYVDAFDITTIDLRTNSSMGSKYAMSENVNEAHVFIRKGGRDVGRMTYDDRIKGYIAESVGLLAEHMFKFSQDTYTDSVTPQLVKIVYQKRPNSILWGIDINGYIYSCSLQDQSSVIAWQRMEVGGVTDEGIPKVLSIASLPSREGSEDDLMMLVKRTINSVDVVFFEKLRSDFWQTTLNPSTEEKYKLPVFMDTSKVFKLNTDMTFYANMVTDGDAKFSDGTGTATETSTVTYARGWAQFNGSSYIDYDGTSNADVAQVGCVRWKWSKGKQGSNTTSPMICICKASGDSDNLIQVFWNSSNEIGITVLDSAGAGLIAATFGTVDLNQYTGRIESRVWDFELNYDFTTGATRLFVNGKQLGDTETGTGTRDTTIDLIRVGADFDAATISSTNNAVSELAIFSTVQHTADFEVFEAQPSGTTIYGLDYLEGQVVKVLADGLVQSDKTVASGAITLDDTYSTVIVGLAYEHLVEPLPPNFGGAIGTRQGETTRLDRVIARFEGTAACEAGPDESNTDDIIFRDSATALADPIVLVTDDKEIELDGGYGLNETVVLKGSDPLPCNITCLVVRGIAYE